MILPFVLFWILVFFGVREHGWRPMLIAIAIWAALLAGFVATGISPFYFVVPQALLDIVLLLMIFGRDIRIH